MELNNLFDMSYHMSWNTYYVTYDDSQINHLSTECSICTKHYIEYENQSLLYEVPNIRFGNTLNKKRQLQNLTFFAIFPVFPNINI